MTDYTLLNKTTGIDLDLN